MGSGTDNEVKGTFEVQGCEDDLYLLSLDGVEEVSRLFSMELRFAAGTASLDLEGLIGKEGLVTLESDEGERHFHGILSELEQGSTGAVYTQYRATLVPSAWRLTRRFDCRIFQKMSAQKIVKKVLDDGHVVHDFHSRGNQAPPERIYCVQYRESDWDFVCRLLEEEGYHFYFEHEAGQELLHITNESSRSPAISGEGELNYHAPSGELPGQEHIFRLDLRHAVRSGKVSLTDYNFESPSLDLRSQAEASVEAALEVYDYPGNYVDQAGGKRLGKIRLEEQQAGGLGLHGASDCPRLVSGMSFKLQGHPRQGLNKKKYFLLRLRHRVHKGEADMDSGALDSRVHYENDFAAMPRQVPFRPSRITQRPMIHGVQTAVVVGPSSEEIYTDEHGRVKVQFHWDRLGGNDEHSSCWVRVSQGWAGLGWGAMHIPRIGQEVIVDFLEGDPDRPIITGRVYHAQNPPPYTLPHNKTRSTVQSESSPGGNGFNEIRFEDAKGAEEVYTHAELDQNEEVERNMSTWVGNDQTLSVDRDREKEVRRDEQTHVHRDRTETVGRHERIEVQGNRTELVVGDEQVTIKEDRGHLVKGGQSVTVKKDASLTVAKNETERVGLSKQLLVGSAYSVRVGATLAMAVGVDMVRKVAGALSETVGRSKTITVGSKLEIVCGDSRLVMDKSGKISLQGSNIRVVSTGPVRVKGKALAHKGKSFKVQASGPITLKGSKINEN